MEVSIKDGTGIILLTTPLQTGPGTDAGESLRPGPPVVMDSGLRRCMAQDRFLPLPNG
jgi:hypothetical protein